MCQTWVVSVMLKESENLENRLQGPRLFRHPSHNVICNSLRPRKVATGWCLPKEFVTFVGFWVYLCICKKRNFLPCKAYICALRSYYRAPSTSIQQLLWSGSLSNRNTSYTYVHNFRIKENLQLYMNYDERWMLVVINVDTCW